MRAPFTRAGAWPELRPGRFAGSLRTEPHGCVAALLGLPDDLGVRLNGGRPGAHAGPSAFRAALSRFGTPWDGARAARLSTPVFDAGDLIPADGDDPVALFETHQRAEQAARWLQDLGLVVIAVGGGHDLSLPALRALAKHRRCALAGVNLDAHLDLRERVGSGMPFRALIEGGFLEPQRFLELGLGRFANDEGDSRWATHRGVRLLGVEALLEGPLRAGELLGSVLSQGPGFVSIDLDSLDQSVAPGVSAPNPLGLGVATVAAIAEAAGRDPNVAHFDVMELCPAHDEGGRTARVAARLFLSFVAGLEQRLP